jgi:glutaredoxin 3
MGLDFIYKELGKDFDREEILERFPGARTFPQIIVDGNAVGGFDQFAQYLKEAA